MVDVQPKSLDSGKTRVIMPISDRRHDGNAQRKIFFIITPVCACYSGPCVLLMALRRTQNMEPNICRGNWSKKQCCKRLCTEKRTCSCPRPGKPDGNNVSQSEFLIISYLLLT
ncbi:hypothetical protein CHARACLAT_017611 [Characodon lateralis]|uniref:Uncharacterized protein n=1 Tax=Characodon lateralis TaxID=208331 RepID=A0ABU7CYH1_9TELE|nr:hypothetical protein [Characodon lateralis]